jgi:hypothetical protein
MNFPGAYVHPFFQRDKPSLCQYVNRKERETTSSVGKALLSSLGAFPASHSISEPYIVTPTTNSRFTDDRTESSTTEFILGPQKHLECRQPQNRHLGSAIVAVDEDATTSGVSAMPLNISSALEAAFSGIAKPNAPGSPNIFAGRSGERVFYTIEGFPPILQSDLEPTPLKQGY